MSLFSEGEQDRIAAAIADAERSTSGEIVAVVAAESASYLHVSVMVAALVALLVPWPLVYFTWWPVQWIYAAQLAVFALLLLTLLPRRIRFALVPRGVKHQRAHRRAVEQFLAQNLHTTAGSTGVLIFLSVAERYAEVLADERINSQVPPGTWQAIVDELTAGIGEGRAADALIAAISSVGGLLAAHFPPGSADRDELPNHLIVLE
jgi:putative membrane protein